MSAIDFVSYRVATPKSVVARRRLAFRNHFLPIAPIWGRLASLPRVTLITDSRRHAVYFQTVCAVRPSEAGTRGDIDAK